MQSNSLFTIEIIYLGEHEEEEVGEEEEEDEEDEDEKDEEAQFIRANIFSHFLRALCNRIIFIRKSRSCFKNTKIAKSPAFFVFYSCVSVTRLVNLKKECLCNFPGK